MRTLLQVPSPLSASTSMPGDAFDVQGRSLKSCLWRAARWTRTQCFCSVFIEVAVLTWEHDHFPMSQHPFARG